MKSGCRNAGQKVGILLAQLGTPDAPTSKALRRYLKEFLSDRRVIELNPILWWFILNAIVLRTRPQKSAKLYERIWTDRGSPLLLTTQAQADKLSAKLKIAGNDVEVAIGMRYGNPSLELGISRLVGAGCERIVVLPLYPQYAAPTTASVYDKLFPALLRYRHVPTIKIVEPFFNNPLYIKGVAASIREFQHSNPSVEKLLISYHGVPVRYVEAGDPYCCMCTATTSLIQKELGLPPENFVQTYQSRFGKEPWLTPYTDETAIKLAKEGVKRIAVVCPGFVTDCLETLDEIGNELSRQFIEAGGESLTLIPCLNDSDSFIDCLYSLVKETAGDWLLKPQAETSILCMSCPSGVVRIEGQARSIDLPTEFIRGGVANEA